MLWTQCTLLKMLNEYFGENSYGLVWIGVVRSSVVQQRGFFCVLYTMSAYMLVRSLNTILIFSGGLHELEQSTAPVCL